MHKKKVFWFLDSKSYLFVFFFFGGTSEKVVSVYFILFCIAIVFTAVSGLKICM